MREKIVLAFDVGTQSSRALLINNRGEILAKSQQQHKPLYVSPYPDWAERDADLYFKDICTCSLDLKEHFPDIFERIEAVSVTTIRDTVVCVDSSGKPLRPAILWLDKRMAEGRPQMSNMVRMALKTVRMEETANLQFRKSHCNWIIQNEPEIWEKTDKFLLLSGYLIFCLTGRMADAAASQVGHIPFDSQHRQWQKKGALTRPVFDVHEDKLCCIVESGQEIGKITAEAAKKTGLPEC